MAKYDVEHLLLIHVALSKVAAQKTGEVAFDSCVRKNLNKTRALLREVEKKTKAIFDNYAKRDEKGEVKRDEWGKVEIEPGKEAVCREEVNRIGAEVFSVDFKPYEVYNSKVVLEKKVAEVLQGVILI
jgi:hypothetical protein